MLFRLVPYLRRMSTCCQLSLPRLLVQFGHLFAKGDTRDAAIRSMVVALKEIKIRGEIRTTVDYTAEMVQHPDFVNNNISTGWLDARIATHVRTLLTSRRLGYSLEHAH